MEEKKIIEGNYSYVENVAKKLKISELVVILGVILLFMAFSMNRSDDDFTFLLSQIIFPFSLLFLVLGGIYLVFVGIAYFYCKSTNIVVTDKRVYGMAISKQVDLPMDSISAVATTSFFKGIAVATSSGRIAFYGIDNREAVYNAINRLLIDRQSKAQSLTAQATPIIQETSGADELKKFKELLDSGVISQEEFDAKKKQLLGL